MRIRARIEARTYLLTVATLLLTFGGCASTPDDAARIPSSGNDCFWAGSIHDWRAVSEQSIVVWSPSKRCPYLVQFPMRCVGIRFAEEIGFADRDGRICPYGGDAVIVPGPRDERCTIASIRKLNPEELAAYIGQEAVPEDSDATVPCPSKPEDMIN
jgi:hypothetical protein